MPSAQQPPSDEWRPKHAARNVVRVGSHDFSWRRASARRSVRAQAAGLAARLAAFIVLLVIGLHLPGPVRLPFLIGAMLVLGLASRRSARAWLTAVRARRYRRDHLAETWQRNASIIARYEQELHDTQTRYHGHRDDLPGGPGEASAP